MELLQRKLTKSEWEGIERPLDVDEKDILKMIKLGYNDVNIRHNNNLSMISYMRIAISPSAHDHLYVEYFKKKIDRLCLKYSIEVSTHNISTKKLNKSDLIRINNINTNSYIPYTDPSKHKMIYEYLMIHVIELLLKHIHKGCSEYTYYYYTLKKLSKLVVSNINTNVNTFITTIIESYVTNIKLTDVISQSTKMIEHNEYLINYSDISLYDHQKQLFSTFKSNRDQSKLVMYIAPTATGKTLSPIGLAESYKIIFVCAARHVGLALAKSSISAGRKIALAFDCKDSEDVRLHYSSVKEAIRDVRNGTIRKVDNTVGDLVEIMICDIKSYIPAMYYMLAFNDKQDCIVYWDEPTITMDYEDHPFHSIIKTNWSENLIPNIVLSSATLPKENDIPAVINDYTSRFGGKTVSIISHDCNKSIPLINRKGETYLPHHTCSSPEDVLSMVAHCESYPTIMRYMDLTQIVQFILFINSTVEVSVPYQIDTYFTSVDNISMINIKIYYLRLLKNIAHLWTSIKPLDVMRQLQHRSNIHIVTSDAHTLAEGPTIYLADDVSKIASFCLQEANIPKHAMDRIMEDIRHNNSLNIEIMKLEHNYEDGIKPYVLEEQENKMNSLRIPTELKILKQKIEQLKNNIKSTNLNDAFIPNRKDHLKIHCPTWVSSKQLPFTCNISDAIIVKIMKLDDIIDSWKVLLLMGIGVFTNHKSIAYTEIMKELSEQEKLFMIIASTDFIYGTNYQFCQGYIGKDLINMTQEKSIQAMGRIGRNGLHRQYSIRFRDDSILNKLFISSNHKPEILNMNKLFTK
jgi:hypothetical protein